MKRVLALGHSHMGALNLAYAKSEGVSDLPFKLTQYQFLRGDRSHIVNPDNTGWRYHPDIERELIELFESQNWDMVVTMLQGEQAASAGLLAPVRPYDFFFPGESVSVTARKNEIVPFELIRRVTKEKYRLIEQFLDLVAMRLPAKCIALSPPPIVGETQFILSSNIQHADISARIAELGLPTTDWRLRLWTLHSMVLKAIYEDRKIAFIAPPRESVGVDGCLRKEFREDVFHANADYGQLLLTQIARLLV